MPARYGSSELIFGYSEAAKKSQELISLYYKMEMVQGSIENLNEMRNNAQITPYHVNSDLLFGRARLSRRMALISCLGCHDLHELEKLSPQAIKVTPFYGRTNNYMLESNHSTSAAQLDPRNFAVDIEIATWCGEALGSPRPVLLLTVQDFKICPPGRYMRNVRTCICIRA